MRNMSFALTEQQFVDGSKDVTRRFGWWFLKPGDRVRAVRKAMGLKKGEKAVELGFIEIVSTRPEMLCSITQDDCRREGFPDYSPEMFTDMLQDHYECEPTAVCNRIEFKRVA